eukprot:jgi/Tetstr1/432492/TSEL_021866.t1
MGGCFSSDDKPADSKTPAGKPSAGQAPANTAAQAPAAPAKAAGKDTEAFGMAATHTLGKALGSGACGEVWLMTEKATGTQVAVKVMPRPIPKKYEQRVVREVKIHGNVGASHPNIVSGYDAVLTGSHFNLVIEYCEGGTMLDYVLKKCKDRHAAGQVAPILDEDEARFFFHQLLNAVEHIHNALVAHRDLKLENTLLKYVDVDGTPFPVLKICDFGFANFFEADAILFTNLGTPPYMSPEVIRSNEGYSGIAADVWSCGVFLYAMLLGTFPFRFQDTGNDTMEFRDLWIQQTKYKWDDQKHTKRLIQYISPEAKDLLDQIFQPDKSQRAALPKIRQHPWMQKPLSAKYQKALEAISSKTGARDAADAPPALGKMPSISFGAGAKVGDTDIEKLVHAACSTGEPGETTTVALQAPEANVKPAVLTALMEEGSTPSCEVPNNV